MDMPSIGKYVSANSSDPVKGSLSPRPGRLNQRASRAFITNQPELAGTSPASVCSSSASGTTVGMIRRAPRASSGGVRVRCHGA